MKDELIIFETAKLAKEKGLEIGLHKGYLEKRQNEFIIFDLAIRLFNSQSDGYEAPTQSLLQKWLREKHDIEVNVVKCWSGSDDWEYGYEISYEANPNLKRATQRYETIESFSIGIGSYTNNVSDSSDWEKVFEDGLIKALSLIPSRQTK